MDVNDCPPHFSKMSYTALVAENSEVGDIITILTATDEDEGNHGQVFSIIIFLFQPCLRGNEFQVYIIIYDSGFFVRSSIASARMKMQ